MKKLLSIRENSKKDQYGLFDSVTITVDNNGKIEELTRYSVYSPQEGLYELDRFEKYLVSDGDYIQFNLIYDDVNYDGLKLFDDFSEDVKSFLYELSKLGVVSFGRNRVQAYKLKDGVENRDVIHDYQMIFTSVATTNHLIHVDDLKNLIDFIDGYETEKFKVRISYYHYFRSSNSKLSVVWLKWLRISLGDEGLTFIFFCLKFKKTNGYLILK